MLEILARRRPCLRFRRFTSLRDLEALAEVERRLREGTVTADAEYDRPYTVISSGFWDGINSTYR